MPALTSRLATRLAAVLLALPGLSAAQGIGGCSISSALPVVFGTYSPLAYTDQLAQSSITVGCLGFGVARVSLLSGLGSTSILDRAMRSGTSRLAYQLYRDSARTQVWGDGTAGTTQAQLPVFLSASTTWQVYARIPQRQDVPVGLYTDMVQVRVDF